MGNGAVIATDAAPARSPARARVGLAIGLLAIAAALGLFVALRDGAAPKRFAEVVAGQLFRSGELSPAQLEQVTRERGIKTVLSLLNPDAPVSAAERAEAERIGLRWINVPLRGNGASTPEAREQMRAALLDPSLRPLLVHCAAGTNRTGLAVGMYRMHEQGWTYSQVLDEMKRFDFEDEEDHENLRAALREEERLAQTSRAPSSAPAAAP